MKLDSIFTLQSVEGLFGASAGPNEVPDRAAYLHVVQFFLRFIHCAADGKERRLQRVAEVNSDVGILLLTRIEKPYFGKLVQGHPSRQFLNKVHIKIDHIDF